MKKSKHQTGVKVSITGFSHVWKRKPEPHVR